MFKDILVDSTELDEKWCDGFLEELSEALYAVAESNRLERLEIDAKGLHSHHRNTLRELLTELNVIAFNNKPEKVLTYWKDYEKELEEL